MTEQNSTLGKRPAHGIRCENGARNRPLDARNAAQDSPSKWKEQEGLRSARHYAHRTYSVPANSRVWLISSAQLS